MPGLDGIDLLKHTTYTHPRLPVIAVSDVEDEGIETLLSQLEITRQLTKPIKKEALQSLIATGYLDEERAPNSTILYDCAGEFADEFATRLRGYFRIKRVNSRQSPNSFFERSG